MALSESINVLFKKGISQDAKFRQYNALQALLTDHSFTSSETVLVIKLVEELLKDHMIWPKLNLYDIANNLFEPLIKGFKDNHFISCYVETFISKDSMNNAELFDYNLPVFLVLLKGQTMETRLDEEMLAELEMQVLMKPLIKALKQNCRTLPTELCFKYIHLRIIPQIFSKDITHEFKEDLFDLVFEMPIGFTDRFMTPELIEKYKSDLQTKYLPFIWNIRNRIGWWDYCKVILHYSGKILHSAVEITNSLLKLMSDGFKTKNVDIRCGSYECWKVLIENYNLDPNYITNPKRMRLLLKPLAANITKNNTVILKRFEAFAFFIEKLNNPSESVIKDFLDFCFGPLQPSLVPTEENCKENVSQGRIVKEILPKSAEILLQLMGHKGPQACCDFKNPTLNTHNIQQFLFPTNLMQHIDMFLTSVMVCTKLTPCWTKGYETCLIINCLWTSLLRLFKDMPEKDNEVISKKLFEVFKEVLKLQETDSAVYSVFGKYMLKTWFLFISSMDHNETVHFHLVTPMIDCIIMHNINNVNILPKSIFTEGISPLIHYCKGGDFPGVIENLLGEKYLKSEFYNEIILFGFHQCTKILSEKSFESQARHKELLVNLLMLIIKHNLGNNTWPSLKLVLKKVHIEYEITSRLKLELQANPNLACKVIGVIPNIFEYITKANILFFKDLVELIEMSLAIPILTEKPDIKTVLNKILDVHIKYHLENYALVIFNCFENVIKVHKLYNILSILLEFVVTLNLATRSLFPKNLRNLIFDLSVSASEDISLKAIEILAKLENSRKSVVISSNCMSRAAKIATMAVNNSPGLVNGTNVNVLRLFGQDIETKSPLKVRGSLLDDKNKPSPTPSKVNASKTKQSENKTPIKTNHEFLNELSESQFVVIDKEVNFNPKEVSEHQKEVIKRQRQEIPALYEGLSQSITQSLDVITKDTTKEESPKQSKNRKNDLSIDNKEPVILETRLRQKSLESKTESPKTKQESPKTKPESPKKRKSNEISNGMNEYSKISKNCPIKEEARLLINNILKEQVEIFAASGNNNVVADATKSLNTCVESNNEIKIENGFIKKMDEEKCEEPIKENLKNISMEIEEKNTTDKIHEEQNKTIEDTQKELITQTDEIEKPNENEQLNNVEEKQEIISIKNEEQNKNELMDLKVILRIEDLENKAETGKRFQKRKRRIPSKLQNTPSSPRKPVNTSDGSQEVIKKKRGRPFKKLVNPERIEENKTGTVEERKILTRRISKEIQVIQRNEIKADAPTEQRQVGMETVEQENTQINIEPTDHKNIEEKPDGQNKFDEKLRKKHAALEHLKKTLKMNIVGEEEYRESGSKRVRKQKTENVSNERNTRTSKKKETDSPKRRKGTPLEKNRKSLLSLKLNDSKVEKIESEQIPTGVSEDIIEGSETISSSIKNVRISLFNDDDDDDDFNRIKDPCDSLALTFDEDMKDSIEEIIGVPKNRVNLNDTETADINDSLNKSDTNETQNNISTDISSQTFNLELTVSKNDDSNIICSPITSDTPTRNYVLFNNTLDISPIKGCPKNTNELRESPDIFSNNEEPIIETEPVVQTEPVVEAEPIQATPNEELPNDESCLKSASHSTKLPNLIPHPLIRSQKTFFENSSRFTNTSSPKTDRVRKMMQNCEENKRAEDASAVNEVLSLVNNIDILNFDREVPSPLATPKISILKRKLPDFTDEGISPLAKRKRVNFCDPPTTSEKIYFKDVEENSHFKKKKKKVVNNMLPQFNKCDRNLETNDSIRGMQNTIECLTSDEVNRNTDQMKKICENGVNYLDEVNLDDAEEAALNLNSSTSQPSDTDFSVTLQMLQQFSNVIKTNYSKDKRLELFKKYFLTLTEQFDLDERKILASALLNIEPNFNNF